MLSDKPVRVLDLYCGESPPVLYALKKRFAGRPIEYVGIDSKGRPSFERRSPDGSLSYRYIDAVIRPEDPEKIDAMLGRFEDRYFDEIHMHMPGTNDPSENHSFLTRLSRLLKANGKLYATIQSEGSPLFAFRLHNLFNASSNERELFYENHRNIRRAAAESDLRLDKYGANSNTTSRWITLEKDFTEPNDYKQRKILEVLKMHSSDAPRFANHFVILRRVR